MFFGRRGSFEKGGDRDGVGGVEAVVEHAALTRMHRIAEKSVGWISAVKEGTSRLWRHAATVLRDELDGFQPQTLMSLFTHQ